MVHGDGVITVTAEAAINSMVAVLLTQHTKLLSFSPVKTTLDTLKMCSLESAFCAFNDWFCASLRICM